MVVLPMLQSSVEFPLEAHVEVPTTLCTRRADKAISRHWGRARQEAESTILSKPMQLRTESRTVVSYAGTPSMFVDDAGLRKLAENTTTHLDSVEKIELSSGSLIRQMATTATSPPIQCPNDKLHSESSHGPLTSFIAPLHSKWDSDDTIRRRR